MQEGMWSILNPVTGSHRVIQIRFWQEYQNGAGCYTLAAITGPERVPVSLGRIEGTTVVPWNRPKAVDTVLKYRRFFWGFLANKLPGELEVLECIPCSRCGELLTNPVSIKQGVGPVCAGR